MKVMERRIKWFRGVCSFTWSLWDVWDVDELISCRRHTNAESPVRWTDQKLRQNLASFRSEGNVECNPGLSPRCFTAPTLRIASILHSIHPHAMCLCSAKGWGMNVSFTVSYIILPNVAAFSVHSPSQDTSADTYVAGTDVSRLWQRRVSACLMTKQRLPRLALI